MHEPQQNRRIAAAKTFMESLEQLHNILAQEPPVAESEFSPEGKRSSSNWMDLRLLEEAAADLDEFFGDTQPPEEGS